MMYRYYKFEGSYFHWPFLVLILNDKLSRRRYANRSARFISVFNFLNLQCPSLLCNFDFNLCSVKCVVTLLPQWSAWSSRSLGLFVEFNGHRSHISRWFACHASVTPRIRSLGVKSLFGNPPLISRLPSTLTWCPNFLALNPFFVSFTSLALYFLPSYHHGRTRNSSTFYLHVCRLSLSINPLLTLSFQHPGLLLL
jgi:hypothetical protein